MQIFYKKDNRSINDLFMTFPAEYLAIFSDRYRSEIWDNGAKSITIIGGDKAVYKEIFDWMLDSIHQDMPTAAPVPEVSLLFYMILADLLTTTQFDESTPNVFRKYAGLIVAAAYLEVPARDFADHIIKKTLFKLSRDKLMSWDEVDFYIESFQGDSDTDEKMREVLTNSIANAWWKGNLREADDEDDNDYCILSVLRTEHSQLDEDLHTWCEKNEARIRGKWAEKDAQKNGGGAAAAGNWDTGAATAGADDWDTPGAAGGGSDWGDVPATTGVVGDWNAGGDAWAGNENGTAAAPKASGGWDDSGIGYASENGQKENMAPAEAAGWDTGAMPSVAAVGGDTWDDGGHGGDWAEEVIADEQISRTSW